MDMILGDVLALIIVVVVFFLAFFFKEFRRPSLIVIYMLGILLRFVFLLYSTMYSYSWMDDDALRVLDEAANGSGAFNFAIGYDFFKDIVSLLFTIFGESWWLMQVLPIMFFGFSCVILLKLNRLINSSRSSFFILFVFTFSPMTILMTSQPMRESYQLFFFMLGVYFLIKLYEDKTRFYFILGLLSFLFMGLLHKMLIGYVLFLLCLVLVWRFDSFKRMMSRYSVFIGAAVAYFAWLTLQELSVPGLGAVQAVLSGGVVDVVNAYRDSLIIGRASYILHLDSSSIWVFLLTFFKVIIYYFLMPFPWMLHGLSDMYAFVEVFVRALLLWFSIKEIRHSHNQRRKMLLFLIIIYVVLSVLWALGVGNYGTALRHFMISSWILLLIGGELLVRRMRSLLCL